MRKANSRMAPMQVIAVWIMITSWSSGMAGADDDGGIQPYSENPFYWQYEGKPVLLLGGSDEDNPFQWTGRQRTDHLDLLVSVGGNYLRNTMSDRDEGNVYAFQRVEEGRYDLNQWNDPYWDRLRFFLDETRSRGIIVQVTLWDQHDHSGGLWRSHPWNPQRNVNYDSQVIRDRNDFYAAVQENNQEILQYQERFIDKLTSVTFDYPHVLYNINNESWAGVEWEAVRRFCWNIFAGCASSRFHRPAEDRWGIGLGPVAQAQLTAMRMLLTKLDIFSCSPHNDLLTPLDISCEAYCLADIGRQYAVYFPDGRQAIELDPWVFVDSMTLRWLDIERGEWSEETVIPVERDYFDPQWLHKAKVRLQTPDNRPHVALLRVPMPAGQGQTANFPGRVLRDVP